MAIDVGVHGRNERIVIVLKHSDRKVIRESLSCGVEVAYHGVSAPPPCEVDGGWVHLRN